MTGEREEQSYGVLADQRLSRRGLHVKLDKGFDAGTYCIYIEFDELSDRVGFAAARRSAGEYCALLKEQLGRLPGHALGETEDHSQNGGPRRRRDLELTFLSFPVETSDGRFHDAAMREQFRVAFLRAGQAWEQAEARGQTHRRHTRQENFRQQLAGLLEGEGYAGMDAATKERLLEEVPALAFPLVADWGRRHLVAQHLTDEAALPPGKDDGEAEGLAGRLDVGGRAGPVH